MLSVCRGPVQCSPARLELLFTQPLWPDWEALFSHPGAFQRKPPAEAPRLRYTTLKTIHSASFPPSRCVLWLHTHHIKNTVSVWNIPAEAACGVSATKKLCVFLCSHGQRCFLHPGNYPPSHSAIADSITIEFLLLSRTFRGPSAAKKGQ